MPEHIFLYGPPGAGKTTIGQKLAERLALPFVDLDQEIEQVAGIHIAEIFSQIGESGFRSLECDQLESAISKSPCVIALGGGTLLDPQNRKRVEASGIVICLSADIETLYKRTGSAPDVRPLLAKGRRQGLVDLLNKRREHYASFPNGLEFNNRKPEELAWECQILSGRYHLASMSPAYDIAIKRGLITKIDHWLPANRLNSEKFVLSDTTVASLYGDLLLSTLQDQVRQNAVLMAVPANEGAKSIKWLTGIWNFLLDHGADRGSIILALGGGVVGDLAGFSAATFMRGIGWINIPTTLLAMVDAGIGGKTGINLDRGKNLVGAFYPPLQVLIDPGVIETLGQRDFSSGMAEVIKHALIGEPNLLSLCGSGPDGVFSNLDEVISRAASVKIRVVESDPFEMGIRKSLNLGHTIGHAVEKSSNYRLTHGESIAIGLVTETYLAEKIGIARQGLHQEIAQLLKKFYLPVIIPPRISTESILKFTQVDKKKSGSTVLFPLLTDFGEIQMDVVIPDLRTLISEFRDRKL